MPLLLTHLLGRKKDEGKVKHPLMPSIDGSLGPNYRIQDYSVLCMTRSSVMQA